MSWLTVLGDEIVAELGGADPMRTVLEPTCKIHEYPGGVVIQAGENPQLGGRDTRRHSGGVSDGREVHEARPFQ